MSFEAEINKDMPIPDDVRLYWMIDRVMIDVRLYILYYNNYSLMSMRFSLLLKGFPSYFFFPKKFRENPVSYDGLL